MARTLSSTLQAAQDGQSHHPVKEVLVSQWTPDIPFDGQELFSNPDVEYGSSLIVHSSGALISAYMYYEIDGYGLRHDYMRFAYSDADRININYVDFAVSGAGSIRTSICEMADGNIGVIFSYASGGSTYLGWKILSPVGAVVNAGGTIFSTSAFISLGNVLKLSSGSYVVVYSWFDGTHYHIFRRTSADFITWSAASECVIAGLTDGNRKYTPFLNQVANNDLWLWFSYVESVSSSGEELTNIYYSISTNGMTSWGAAVKHTTYSTYTATAKQPFVLNVDSTTQKLVYNLHKGTLIINSSTAGWCSDGHAEDASINISWDSARRKIYFTTVHASPANVNSVKEVDMDTWAITNCWGPSTTPALIPISSGITYINKPCRSEGKYVAILYASGGTTFIEIINAENNTVTKYVSSGGDKNLFNIDYSDGNSYAIYARVDNSSDRLWLVKQQTTRTSWGYIDLTNTTSATFHETGHIDYASSYGYLNVENNLAIVWTTTALRVCVLDGENAGDVLNTFTSGFPNNIRQCVYSNDKVFMWNYPSDSNYYGLQIADMATGVVSTEFPSFISPVQAVWFNDMKVAPDGRIALAGRSYSPNTGFLCLFDPGDNTWVTYSSVDMPSLSTSGFYSVLPDLMLTDGYILGNNPVQLTCINLNGSFDQSQCETGTLSGGVWTWDTAAPLVQGFNDYDASLCLDPDDGGLYAFWTHLVLTTSSIYWDKDAPDFPLQDLIVRGTPISIEWNAENQPTSAKFTVAKGDLFDRFNAQSLWRTYLKKGQKIVIRFGEKVDDNDYFENQAVLCIKSVSVSYERPDYPVMEVTCADRTSVWNEHVIPATDHYKDEYGETIVTDLITEHSDFTSSDLDVPVFTDRRKITYQGLDTSLTEILDLMCDTFQYFYIIDADGKFTLRKIDTTKDADHVYADLTKIINFTPDDTYSDNTCKWIVTGEELLPISVTMDEECVGKLNATVGWYKGEEEYQVDFSKDKQRTCRQPRLVVISSVTGMMQEMFGGVDEYISYEDPNNKYCTITVEVPNLIGVLLGAIGVIVANHHIGDIITSPGDLTKKLGTLFQTIATVIALNVLGSITNVSYEIWAHPVGSMRRSVYGEAEDLEYLAQIGMEVKPDTEESQLCYTNSQCQTLAEFKKLIAQMKRKQCKFTKVAHLQDEVGDIIQVPHPKSGYPLKVFVTHLTRTMVVPESNDSNDGKFTDEITGWVVNQ